MAKKKAPIIEAGSINTQNIKDAHEQIRKIADSFKTVNLEVDLITKRIKENWVGEGRNEFQSQYQLLIRKIEDFGDTLEDIYQALVEAEAEYAAADDSLRQEFVKAIES